MRCFLIILLTFYQASGTPDPETVISEAGRSTDARGRAQEPLIGQSQLSKASLAHAYFAPPSEISLDIQRKSNALLEASDRLTKSVPRNRPAPFMAFGPLRPGMPPPPEFDRIIDILPGRRCVKTKITCDIMSRFRTIDGTCNNINHPEFGSAQSPYRRLMPPAYDDELNKPRTKCRDGSELPNARKVSLEVHPHVDRRDRGHTQLLMQWGQFLDHDITLTPQARAFYGSIMDCGNCNSARRRSSDCLPIKIPAGDPVFTRNTCMDFVRSQAGQLTLGAREQMNQITSYIDGSNVYGSDETTATRLRQSSGGLLKVQSNGLLPKHRNFPACSDDATADNKHCFMADDVRSNVQIGLMSMHSMWVNQHNSVARKLARINPHWDNERLYQETRRIIIGQQQHITYSEFLPQVLGQEFMEKYDLTPKTTGFYYGYDSSCDATIYNEFAAAAYRFGHSLVDDRFHILGDRGSEIWNLTGRFMDPTIVYDMQNRRGESNQKILVGMAKQRCQHADRFVSNALRNHLFGTGLPGDGLDLVALNIQRGRDHGLQPYVKNREAFGLSVPTSFADLNPLMEPSAVRALSTVYKSVDDIDLFSGILAENKVFGALVGPLAAHILGAQFHRLKSCDRYFYENGNQIGSFTESQLDEIRKSSLFTTLCLQMEEENSGPGTSDLFSKFGCTEKSGKIDLNHWRETPSRTHNRRRQENRRRGSLSPSFVERRIAPRCFPTPPVVRLAPNTNPHRWL